MGMYALGSNIDGYENTATGYQALYSNTQGYQNIAYGNNALYSNNNGYYNTAIGNEALKENISGSRNTAVGISALNGNITGAWNTAIGQAALYDTTSGTNNIGIGYIATVPDPTGSNQVQIGNSYIESLYCMGAFDGIVGSPNRALYADINGKIGYVSSSARYKNNIASMEIPDWLFRLRPVNFTYKNDELNLKQYGLIAEEVEKVNPSLVSYNKEGQVETVSYSKLITPMLKVIQEQQEIIENQNKNYENLLKRVEQLEQNHNQ